MTIPSKRRALLQILCIFLFECLEAKKFGGSSGGSNRGVSGARHNPQPHPAPAGGGQQPHFGGGPGMQPNYRPGGGGSFHPGGGAGMMGSPQRSSAFKSALAGAAIGTVGGLLAFEAGKAIIHSFDRPFHYENRDYYWGQEYAKRRPDEHICTYSFDQLIAETTPTTTTTVATPSEGANPATTTPSPEQALAHATFPNGTRPKQIVWTCKNSEICCGTECCPSPQSVSRADGSSNGGGALSTFGKILLIITIVGLLLCCCCVAVAYKFCRSAFDSFMPRGNNNSNNQQQQYDNDGQERYDNMGGGYGQQQQPYYNNQAQSYPMQPYVGSTPAPNAYPQAPQPPAQYPAYPPAPGYYEGQKY